MRPAGRRALFLLAAIGGAASARAALIENARQPTLRMGSDGLGVVAFHDRFEGDAVVAHCVDAACSAVTRSVVDSAGDVGSRLSMTIAPNGRPVLAYRDRTNSDLKLAFCADVACSTATLVVIDDDVAIENEFDAGQTALTYGGDGMLLVAYADLVAPFDERLKITHCQDATCTVRTTATVADVRGSYPIVMGTGADGLGFLVWHRGSLTTTLAVAHCSDAACAFPSVRPAGRSPLLPLLPGRNPALAFQPDGHPAFMYEDTQGAVRYVRCQDAACTASSQQPVDVPIGSGPSSLAFRPGGLPRIVLAPVAQHPTMWMYECQDAACAQHPRSCAAPGGTTPSLATDAAGLPLVAFARGDSVVVRRLALPGPAACAREMWIENVPAIESDPGQSGHAANFFVTALPVSSQPATVAYQTEDGTAVAGADYSPISGVVTVFAGQAGAALPVGLVADNIEEPTETFAMRLSSATGATLSDAYGVAYVEDDDPGEPFPIVDAHLCNAPEGDAGQADCAVEVTLSESPRAGQPLTVSFATSDATATAGVDYVAQSGSLTFPPGTTSRTVVVPVLGDGAIETDEAFRFDLLGLQNGQPGQMETAGIIRDDDAPSLSTIELTHGSALTADLASGPDLYRLGQAPYTSWEAVIDGVSGDAAPGLVLQLLAEDNSFVLATGGPTGTGSSRSMRWEQADSIAETREHLRVASTDCAGGCGADDVYRLRVYETTATIPRFNTSGGQATVVILQNLTDQHVTATRRFWTAGGALLKQLSTSIAPHATLVDSLAGVPELAGQSGSITISHTAPYGGLAGKAVAVEPATGLAFDTPLEYRPR